MKRALYINHTNSENKCQYSDYFTKEGRSAKSRNACLKLLLGGLSEVKHRDGARRFLWKPLSRHHKTPQVFY